MTRIYDDYGPVALDDWAEGCSGGVALSLIAPLVPFDAQLGCHPLQDTPKALEAALAPGQTLYAVLDAALISGCEAYLVASGCRHDCLFRGAARAEWGACGPWLVELPRGSRLRRMLFTQTESAPPWQLWRRFPGVLIATQAGFDAVLAHVRRLTRLQTPDGNWLYFRFWERHVLGALAQAQDPLSVAMLAEIDGAATAWIIPDPPAQRALMAQRAPDRTGMDAPRPALTAQTMATLDTATAQRLARAEVAAALRGTPPAQRAQMLRDPQLLDLRAQLVALRVTQPEDRSRAIALYLQAHATGRAAAAWQALTAPGAGAGVRLWHVQQMLDTAEVAP